MERKARDKLLLRSSLFTVYVTLVITLAGYDELGGSEAFRSSPHQAHLMMAARTILMKL